MKCEARHATRASNLIANCSNAENIAEAPHLTTGMNVCGNDNTKRYVIAFCLYLMV